MKPGDKFHWDPRDYVGRTLFERSTGEGHMGRRRSNLPRSRRAVAALAVPAQAQAAEWKIEGRGFGHGVGMSQYGAFGFAKHGSRLQADPPPLLHGREHREGRRRKSVRVLIATGLQLDRLSGTRRRPAARTSTATRTTPSGSPRGTSRFRQAQRLEARRAAARRDPRPEAAAPSRFGGVGTYRGDLGRGTSAARSTPSTRSASRATSRA